MLKSRSALKLVLAEDGMGKTIIAGLLQYSLRQNIGMVKCVNGQSFCG